MWRNRKDKKNVVRHLEVIAVANDLQKLRATLSDIRYKYHGEIISVTWSPVARDWVTPPESGFVVVVEFSFVDEPPDWRKFLDKNKAAR